VVKGTWLLDATESEVWGAGEGSGAADVSVAVSCDLPSSLWLIARVNIAELTPSKFEVSPFNSWNTMKSAER